MKQTLYWMLVWPIFVSQCCANRVSLTVTKHRDFCCTFYKADVTWSCFPGRSAWLPRRRSLSPRKSWTFSFMLLYSWEIMFLDISLICVVSQRPFVGTFVRLPRPLSLMFPYSRRVMIVLRRSLYGVVSDGRAFGLFVPLPQQVW